MEGLYQIKKAHVWAAGAITLLLIAILGSLLFVQNGQINNTKSEIKTLKEDTVAAMQKAESYAQQSKTYKLAAQYEKQRLDSLFNELGNAKKQITDLTNDHEKNVSGYRNMPTDERLRLFAKFVGSN